MRKTVPLYRTMLGWTLRHRTVTLVALLSLAGTAAIPIAMIEKTGEPKTQQREVLIIYQVADAHKRLAADYHVYSELADVEHMKSVVGDLAKLVWLLSVVSLVIAVAARV